MNTVKEYYNRCARDLNGMLPSSSTPPFPTTELRNVQTSRMPALNVTLTNMEAHPKTAKTDPETTYRI